MCRFIAFRGKKPILLKTLLDEAANSLICQSRVAPDNPRLNADGYGVGWYNREVDLIPGVFKSIQPAWNDENLTNIAAKILSDCFIGHVRASTVGGVSTANCHPFSYKNFLFAHNGTIDNFKSIKKDLIHLLEEEYFSKIKGQTDSEYFFFLLCNILEKEDSPTTSQKMAEAFVKGMREIDTLLDAHNLEHHYRINAAITNGEEMTAIRYNASDNHPTLSLYYSVTDDGVVIASEQLSQSDEWCEVPPNSILTIDKQWNVEITSL